MDDYSIFNLRVFSPHKHPFVKRKVINFLYMKDNNCIIQRSIYLCILMKLYSVK